MGHGYRNMYYATGQPGWMRLGYSPGWVGRSRSGLGPCAEYLMTGRWPAVPGVAVGFPPRTDRAAELELLKAQAEMMEQNLARLRERIAELEKRTE